MQYREFPASARLAPFVDRFWALMGEAAELGGSPQPVLPDGRPELIVHFGDPFERVSLDGQALRQPMVLFAGQLHRHLTLRPSGRIAVLGARFHPFGAAAALAMPQHRLTDQTIGVDEISPPLARAMAAVRRMTDDPVAAVPLVERALERTMDEQAIDARVRFAVDAIARSGGAVAVEALARYTSMSRRHLERRFLDQVGLSPKRLARVLRFQRALGVLEGTGAPQRGAVTAATCGYADQSHFIREFRDLAGCSPSEHLLEQGELTGFFLTRLPNS